MTQEVITKVCKQCGREQSIDRYMKYKPRGRGIYNTTTGYHTICKDCESVSSTLAAIQRREADGKATDKDLANKERLVVHYQQLADSGYPPVTAAAKRLLGIDVPVKKRTSGLSTKLEGMSAQTVRSASMRKASEEVQARLDVSKVAYAGDGTWSKELTEFVDKYKTGYYGQDIDQADEDFKAVRSELYNKNQELAEEIDEFCGF